MRIIRVLVFLWVVQASTSISVAQSQPPENIHANLGLEFEEHSRDLPGGMWSFERNFFIWGGLERVDSHWREWSTQFYLHDPNDKKKWTIAISERARLEYEGKPGFLLTSHKARFEGEVRTMAEAKEIAEKTLKTFRVQRAVFWIFNEPEFQNRDLQPIFNELFFSPPKNASLRRQNDDWLLTHNFNSWHNEYRYNQLSGFVSQRDSKSLEKKSDRVQGQLFPIKAGEFLWKEESVLDGQLNTRTIRYFNLRNDVKLPLKWFLSMEDGDRVDLYDTPQIKAEWRDGKIVRVMDNEQALQLQAARQRVSQRYPYFLVLLGVLALIVLGVRQWRRD